MNNERPILFSAPMVRAILAGIKTQTRRLVKPQPSADFLPTVGQYHRTMTDPRDGEQFPSQQEFYGAADENEDYPCRFGRPGSMLWVRETWKPCWGDGSGTEYKADERGCSGPWKPSISMTRARCRLTLEITAIRCQRLHEITTDDILAEGVRIPVNESGRACIRFSGPHPPIDYFKGDPRQAEPHVLLRAEFASLWDHINGKTHPWTSNPWVWVVSFKTVNHEP